MLRLDVCEVRVRFSEIVERLRRRKEDVVVITRRNVPVAEMRAVPVRPVRPLLITPRRGFRVPDSFFAPLTDDVLDEFERHR